MMYLLPCEKCDAKVPVGTQQAGQTVRCTCGAAVDVPTLRDIRQLEQAAQVAEGSAERNKKPNRHWSLGHGAAFVGGSIAMVIGLGMIGIGFLNLRALPIPIPVPYDAQAADAEVDSWPMNQALAAWVEMREEGIGPYLPPTHVIIDHMTAQIWRFINIGIVVAVIGLSSVVVALVVGRRKRASG